MKNEKGVTRDFRKMLGILQSLWHEVGVYDVYNYGSSTKLILQCDEKLTDWLHKNGLEYNCTHMGFRAFENDFIILFEG